MTRRTKASQIAKVIMGAAAALALQGCITIQAIEPVIEPPHQFMGNVTVPVEFAMPGTIGFRCAERGATFFGLPGINSGACADTTLVTMLDPCMTVTAGAYAQSLCEGLRQYREETNAAPTAPVAVKTQQATPTVGLVKASYSVSTDAKVKLPPAQRDLSAWDNVVVEFVAPADVEMRCAERGAKMTSGHDGVLSCADRLMLTVANPCDSPAQSWYTRTLCHEMAHANGWPADHPSYYQNLVLKPASESPQALALARAKADPAQPVLVSADADTSAGASSGLVAAPLTPADLPAELRQLMTNVVSFGLNASADFGAKAPDFFASRLKPIAWVLAPTTKPPVLAASSAAPEAGELAGTAPAWPSPLRGRWYGSLAAGAPAASLQAAH